MTSYFLSQVKPSKDNRENTSEREMQDRVSDETESDSGESSPELAGKKKKNTLYKLTLGFCLQEPKLSVLIKLYVTLYLTASTSLLTDDEPESLPTDPECTPQTGSESRLHYINHNPSGTVVLLFYLFA